MYCMYYTYVFKNNYKIYKIRITRHKSEKLYIIDAPSFVN